MWGAGSGSHTYDVHSAHSIDGSVWVGRSVSRSVDLVGCQVLGWVGEGDVMCWAHTVCDFILTVSKARWVSLAASKLLGWDVLGTTLGADQPIPGNFFAYESSPELVDPCRVWCLARDLLTVGTRPRRARPRHVKDSVSQAGRQESWSVLLPTSRS